MRINTWAMGQTVILVGLAIWMGLVVINNVTDSSTNQHLIGQTLSMALVKDDPLMGNGLEWRALDRGVANAVLNLVIAAQIVIDFLLWRSAIYYLRLVGNDAEIHRQTAYDSAIVALVSFCGLWIGFLCGGLWFGYWMKQGVIQQVHFTLLLVGMGGLMLINNPMPPLSGIVNNKER